MPASPGAHVPGRIREIAYPAARVRLEMRGEGEECLGCREGVALGLVRALGGQAELGGHLREPALPRVAPPALAGKAKEIDRGAGTRVVARTRLTPTNRLWDS